VSEHLKNASSTRRLGHQTHISELVLAGVLQLRFGIKLPFGNLGVDLEARSGKDLRLDPRVGHH